MYSDYRDQSNQTLTHILGSLLHQFLATTALSDCIPLDVVQKLKQIRQQGSKAEIDDIFSLMKLSLDLLDCAFICIDALDELEGKTRIGLVEKLKELNTGAVRLFFTSRHHIQNEIGKYFTKQSKADINADPDDIRQYLKQEIAADTDEDAMDEVLQEEIIAAVVGRSKGM